MSETTKLAEGCFLTWGVAEPLRYDGSGERVVVRLGDYDSEEEALSNAEEVIETIEEMDPEEDPTTELTLSLRNGVSLNATITGQKEATVELTAYLVRALRLYAEKLP